MRLLIALAVVLALVGTGFALVSRTITVQTLQIPQPSPSADAPVRQNEDFSQDVRGLEALVRETETMRIPVAYREAFTALQDETGHPDARTHERLAAFRAELTQAIESENKKPRAAITFDAGAGAKPAQNLIAILRTTHVKITFFLTGKWSQENPALFHDILIIDDAAHNELGDHTWSHPHFVTDGLSDDDIKNQITSAETQFNTLGFSAKPLFRYPYGEHNDHTDTVVSDLGYRIVGWTVDSLGWQGQLTPQQITDRVANRIKPNGIVLMHVGSEQDVDALPLIIERLRNTYRFVFVSEL